MKPQVYLWLDAEFSSLELETAEILQVSMMATDADLRRLAPPAKDVNLFIRREDDRGISPWVKEHIPHIVRGCLSERAVTLSDAEVRLCRYVDEICGPIETKTDQRPILAGNSVHNDWMLVRKFFPGLLHRTHYRLLDVSTLKLQWMQLKGEDPPSKEDVDFIRAYFPDAYLETASGEHDAYYDIQASVAELGFYRKHLLRGESPGRP